MFVRRRVRESESESERHGKGGNIKICIYHLLSYITLPMKRGRRMNHGLLVQLDQASIMSSPKEAHILSKICGEKERERERDKGRRAVKVSMQSREINRDSGYERERKQREREGGGGREKERER